MKNLEIEISLGVVFMEIEMKKAFIRTENAEKFRKNCQTYF